jgi:UDP-galactopyranose mutase
MILNKSKISPTYYDLVIIGSGLFGLTIARRAAEELNLRVLIIEKRTHIGGNAWSELETTTGIEIHKYGTHLFHTSNQRVWDFVNKYSNFRDYKHTVFANVKNQIYSLPINLNTINSFFKKEFTPNEAENFLYQVSLQIEDPRNFEEKVKSRIGEELYDAFYKGYTQKQWGVDPKSLPAQMANRLPIRTTRNNRYFRDIFEGLPEKGYFGLLGNIADHPLIDIKTNTDYFEVRRFINPASLFVYTGPIDQYFNYSLGSLGWRTLDFETILLETKDYQGTAVMNYPDIDIPFTRIHEYKHLDIESKFHEHKTVISREFSRFSENGDEPYYPINTPEDRKKYEKYRELANSEENIIFGGRLGTYKYLDMDMAIASALVTFENKILPRF